ncbi:TPA: hypothetical protein ACG3G9_003786, partial [Clostridioides difficile]
FGWKLENVLSQGIGVVNMKFKRDRKIRNKAELSRLQRQFDACIAEIERLERAKVMAASVTAYIIGIVGTAFIAGAVFAQNSNNILLSVILAVPGFMGWIIPYFMYKVIQRKKTNKVTPLIDLKYDEIYEVSEKGSRLLRL